MTDNPYEIPTQDGNPPGPPHIAARSPIEVTLEAGRYSWCSCGYSQTQPLCDGAHKDPANGTNRRSVKFELSEPATLLLCRCKHTATPPHCDGACDDLPKE